MCFIASVIILGSFYSAKGQLNADFVYSYASGSQCSPVLVNFRDTSTGNVVKYAWTFGNGNHGIKKDPGATYVKEGSYNVTLTVYDAKGDSSTITKTGIISVHATPNPNFSASSTKLCSSAPISFTDLTPANSHIAKWLWDFGDGNTSTQQDPTHTFGSGKFTVTLEVTDSFGCSNSLVKPQYITVGGNASVNFYPNLNFSCTIPQTISFQSLVSGTSGKVKYMWKFGDGDSSSAANPSHNYTSYNKFTVSLTVTDLSGCPTSYTVPDYVTIQQLKASFTASPDKACVPDSVTFTPGAQAICPACSYYWTFGDGGTSTRDTPSHTYKTPGAYNVFLRVSNGGNCDDSIRVKSAVVMDSSLTVSFTDTNNTSCKPPLKVQFKGMSHGANTWFWEFGDGASSTLQNPSHTFLDSGNFNTTLVVRNASGCTASITNNLVHVKQPNVVITTDSAVMPVWYGCVPSSINFTGLFQPLTKVTKWNWDFGDSTAHSTDSTPFHTYTKRGTYSIKLNLAGVNGCSSKDSMIIKIGHEPKAIFDAPLLKTCVDDSMIFYNYSNNKDSMLAAHDTVKADSFVWIFGDGTTQYADSPCNYVKHAYSAPGVYTVSLIAVSLGCPDSVTKQNYIVVRLPVARYSFYHDICTPSYIHFNDYSLGATSWNWDFGDGNGANEQNPGHNYAPGNYTASLTVTDDTTKCTNTFSDTLNINFQSGLDFRTTVIANCTSRLFIFVPYFNNKPLVKGYSIKWDFGDGTTSTDTTASHVFNDTGNFKIELIARKDSSSCADTVIKYQRLYANNTEALFSASPKLISCPKNASAVHFYDESISLANEIVEWLWYFGDGSTSNDENPTKLYDKAGKFNVALKVTDLLGCTDSTMKPNFIVVNGATGDYTASATKGCDSVTVHFTVINSNADSMIWDMADGNILFGPNITYTYRASNNNKYIPILFLTDSNSTCKYSLPPKDTITVLPSPEAAFSYDTSCAGRGTYFYDSSTTPYGSLTNWAWDFGDGGTSILQNPVHFFRTGGFQAVKLTVLASGGCSSTITHQIWVRKLDAGFYAIPTSLCDDDSVHFIDTSYSQLPIVSRLWNFGDSLAIANGKDISTLTNPYHHYSAAGNYTVSEIVTNSLGCTDTLVKTNYISVSDTATPPPIVINFVTVISSNKVDINFEAFSGQGFSSYIIYKKDLLGNYQEIATIDSNTVGYDLLYSDSNVNTNQYSYCYKVVVKTTCDKFSNLNSTIENCTIKLTAIGDANSVALAWNAYIGWDSVKEYAVFRSKIDDSSSFPRGPIAIVLPPQLNYIDTTTICAGKYYYFIIGVFNFQSISNYASAIPIHVNRVPANALDRASVVNDKNILVRWDAAPANAHAGAYVLDRSTDGVKYTFVSSFPVDSFTYLDTNVNVGLRPYYYHTRIIDSCGDTGKISNAGKTILLNVDTSGIDLLPQLNWTKYIYWPEGVQYYTIFRKGANGNFTPIDSTSSGNDSTYIDNKTDLNSLPYYCYHVVAHRNTSTDTSMSNDACLHGERSYIYVPNAFTPNNDGINDRFGAKGMYITEFNMKTYNRWGELVFQSNSVEDTWDGTFHGRACPVDSYIWTITAQGLDNKLRFLQGDVKLLK